MARQGKPPATATGQFEMPNVEALIDQATSKHQGDPQGGIHVRGKSQNSLFVHGSGQKITKQHVSEESTPAQGDILVEDGYKVVLLDDEVGLYARDIQQNHIVLSGTWVQMHTDDGTYRPVQRGGKYVYRQLISK
jgi:hypothetical protein